MILNARKLYEVMARACLNPSVLCKKSRVSRNTFKSMVQGKEVKPATIGRIAKTLGVDVKEILSEED